jgi:hypothetical protein
MVRPVVFSLSLALAFALSPADAAAAADPTPSPEPALASPLPAAEPSPPAASSAAPSPPATSPTLPASALPIGSAAPVPAPSVDQAITIRAIDWLHRLQSGRIDRTQLSIPFNKLLTPDAVTGIEAQLRSLGPVKSYAYVGDALSHGVHGYQYRVVFTAAPYEYLFEIDTKGDVAGILLTPAK